MDVNMIPLLLQENESTALDFKEKEYPFAKANDEEKTSSAGLSCELPCG